MNLVLIFVLIICNGLFAMSEMALVSARRLRLQKLVEEGHAKAAVALALHNEPSSFLSTVQVGITTIGILSGAIGENALMAHFMRWVEKIPALAVYSHSLAFALMIVTLTFLSVVIGELVPKRLALLAPETIAMIMARPMVWLSRLTAPLVWLFSISSSAILRLLGAVRKEEPPVTDEEIKVLMEQGAEAGVFHHTEQAIVSNVLRLDDQRIGAIMTPRKDIVSIDLAEPESEIRAQLLASPYSRVVVCRNGLEHIEGILQISDLVKDVLANLPLSVEHVLREPLYVPETITTTQMLDSFRKARLHFGLIVDEYGDLQGLVTLTDVLTSIVGDLASEGEIETNEAVQRTDGSWLVDGSMTLERFKQVLDIPHLQDEEDDNFHTMGGFVMHHLGHIPQVADHFESEGWRFEVMDMDKNRVDKLLVTALSESEK